MLYIKIVKKTKAKTDLFKKMKYYKIKKTKIKKMINN